MDDEAFLKIVDKAENSVSKYLDAAIRIHKSKRFYCKYWKEEERETLLELMWMVRLETLRILEEEDDGLH